MNSLEIFNGIIDYIEEHLSEDIDVGVLSRKAQLSIYEFRRIFSFLTGVPINEYIRRRRMSCAAEELLSGKLTVTEASLKYGYENPSSFSRAFRDFHGVSPMTAMQNKSRIKTFTKFGFKLGLTGGEEFSYTVIQEPQFVINGICGKSSIDDTECCEKVWEEFYNNALSENEVFFGGQIYAAYLNGEGCVDCYIGARNETTADCGITVPASKWVCFKIVGTADEKVNAFYDRILFEWFRSVGFKRNEALPNLEIYPYDMSSDDFEWEIRIPII